MTNHCARRIVLALACIVPAHRAAAQTVMPGTRVRVVDASSNNPLMVGMLIRVVGDTVTILSEANLASSSAYTVWPVGGQRRLEVRTTLRRATGIGAVVGLVGGAAVGYAIGAASAPADCVTPPGSWLPCDFADKMVPTPSPGAMGAIGGSLVGMLIGGLVGHGIIQSETWQRADRPPVRVGIAPTSRGVMFSASVAF